MRPFLLNPIFSSVYSLAGVGPKFCSLLAKILGIDSQKEVPRLIDLLHFLPRTVIDRRYHIPVAEVKSGMMATLELVVERHFPPQKPSSPYRVLAYDKSAKIALVFFHSNPSWLQKRLPKGETVLVSGKVYWFGDSASMNHPDYITAPSKGETLLAVEPIYSSTASLSQRTFIKIMTQALECIPDMPEWLDINFVQREDFPSYRKAIFSFHNPNTPDILLPTSPARRRLAYDELLADQLALALIRQAMRCSSGSSQPLLGKYVTPLLKSLPFVLTCSQKQAFEEISKDMASPFRMVRLLQGDVGSGKTIVALLAMAQAAETGGQSALMVPTEILARQHYETLFPLLKKIGLKAAFLISRQKCKLRERLLEEIKQGEAQIIIGTHALFQEEVLYKNLTLTIIDEQHRFGVHQRLRLTGKGETPDILVMTATPIPRTLFMTVFGDMDISSLKEKPAGRKSIKTAAFSTHRMKELLQSVERALKRGDKLYWICPLVEKSKTIDLTATTTRFQMLFKRFGTVVGLIHSKMSSTEKEKVIADFKDGKISLLIATTVIEVGIDISDVTVIIIEHAEHFGLAQLHQLRGRVGRGDKPSSCVLLYKEPLSSLARKRLKVIRESEDGFHIAEEDLRLRGKGELLGTKQAGTPAFLLANNDIHHDLIKIAQQEARLILSQDQNLKSSRGRALRLLLYLFRKDEAIHLLQSG